MNITKIAEEAQREMSAVWKALRPKVYSDVGKWGDQRIPPLCMTSTVRGRGWADLKHVSEMQEPAYASICTLAHYDVPTYFVAADLVQALLHTDPPKDLDWMEMPMPFDAMVFMIPRGSLSSGKHEVVGIMLGRCRKGRELPFSAVNLPPASLPVDTLVSVGMCSDLTMYQQNLNAVVDTKFGDIWKQRKLDADRVSMVGYDPFSGEVAVQPTTLDVTELGAICLTLAVNIVLAIQFMPQLLVTGERVRFGMKEPKKGRPETWKPHFIGASYVVRGTPTAKAVAAESDESSSRTVRRHWRRGHFNHQPYGKGRQYRRVIWREPLLVEPRRDQEPESQTE
jgi:hypothetical protein